MIWHDSQNCINDCYFCLIDITDFNKKKRKFVNYPALNSPIRPVLPSDGILIPVFKSFMSNDIDESKYDDVNDFINMGENDNDNDFDRLSSECILFDQEELSDLCRDLCLSKESPKLFASRLKEKSLLKEGTKVAFYCSRNADFYSYFH